MSAPNLLAEVGDLQPKVDGSTGDAVTQIGLGVPRERRAHGPWRDLALHTIGWRAFQDLCSQVCEVVLSRPVQIFYEGQMAARRGIPHRSELRRAADWLGPSASIRLKHERP